MDISNALKLFSSKFPRRKAIGYWTNSEGIILNTVSKETNNISEPGQYVITNSGKIYGTNPINSDLSSKMKFL